MVTCHKLVSTLFAVLPSRYESQTTGRTQKTTSGRGTSGSAQTVSGADCPSGDPNGCRQRLEPGGAENHRACGGCLYAADLCTVQRGSAVLRRRASGVCVDVPPEHRA